MCHWNFNHTHGLCKIILCNLHDNFFSVLLIWWWFHAEPKHVVLKSHTIWKDIICNLWLLFTLCVFITMESPLYKKKNFTWKVTLCRHITFIKPCESTVFSFKVSDWLKYKSYKANSERKTVAGDIGKVVSHPPLGMFLIYLQKSTDTQAWGCMSS